MRTVGSRVAVWIAVASLCVCVARTAGQEQRPLLHPLFTDNAVLQRDVPLRVWGWTAPGAAVKVGLAGKETTAKAKADGRWMATLGALPAGGPHALTVSADGTEATAGNILLGDVWICSGQSNMQWGMWGVDNSAEEIANAAYPRIRLFTVPNVTALEPKELVRSQWHECAPDTVRAFSAVGYFFGRHLHKELDVPIGLVNSSWGGTIAEAWVSGDALTANMPDFVQAVADVRANAKAIREGTYEFDKEMAAWWARNDPGSAAEPVWADPAFAASDWQSMALPSNWEQAGLPDFDGLVWFRKEIDLPAAWAGKDAVLHLGPIDDRDTTFVNGAQVGELNRWTDPRNYKIPGGVLEAGRNIIAVRVLDTGGGGGFHGKPEDMRIETTGADPISLAGEWRYCKSTPLAETTPAPQRMDNSPNVASVLYNAMIAPLVPCAIKGAIWYQGESNAGRAEQYARLLPTLIRDWRARFEVGDFPFLVVQLANFMAVDTEPRNDAWPQLREAQFLATRAVPNAELALAIDIGVANDIHPKNKQDVGLRLALAALGTTYAKDIEYSGPVYTTMKVEDGKVRVSFDHLGGGLVAKGEDGVKGFAIAGEDGAFVWADARIDGDTVLVWADGVEAPAAVRYAWSNNPVCNLYNKAGLPAVPFRTDR